MEIIEFLKIGNQFTFPRSKLIKNQQVLSGNKKDMRRKQVPGFSTMISPRKGATGLKLNSFDPIMQKESSWKHNFDNNFFQMGNDLEGVSNLDQIYEEVRSNYEAQQPSMNSEISQEAKIARTPTQQQESIHKQEENYSKYVGFNGFNKAYDEVEKEMPEAKQYRSLLTKLAKHESGFNAKVQNKAGAPAYGYFQFMQDGKRWNNITKYSGLSIDEFRNNPKEQIKAAIKLAKSFMSSFSQEDINKAKSMGISMSGMIGGAWLGGTGGVKKALNGIDSSDKHWSKDGKTGSSVMECFKRYNNL